MQVLGNYYLNVYFGGQLSALSPNSINELTITQDIERLLPTFKLTVRDATKIFTEIAPYDKNVNKVKIEISQSKDLTKLNTFNFAVKRRRADSVEENHSIEGLLDIDYLLTEDRTEYFTGNLKTNIEGIVAGLVIQDTEVGTSLSFQKDFIQPDWTDAKLLRYLAYNLLGKGDEAGYHCYFAVRNGKVIFIFKSLNELLKNPVSYKFLVGHQRYQDHLPILEYQIFDNSQLIADLGSKFQKYQYFNYDTGAYVENSIDIGVCPSLSEYILFDEDRDTDSVLYTKTGRSNSFTSDFEGMVRNDYFIRTNNFVHMWASTWGLQNIVPGDIVQVNFSESFNRGALFNYQHSGFWMVKRVVHIIGSTFFTNLLLTRAGVTTDVNNTLLRSENRQKK